jgi:hypothetical protein
MKIIIRISILLIIAGIYSCSRDDNQLNKIEPNLERRAIVRQSLKWMTETNPDSMAMNAIKQDSIYLLALRGYGIDIPGLVGYNDVIQNKIPFRVIEGTSDMITSEEVWTLNETARKYALRYNTVILQWGKNHK